MLRLLIALVMFVAATRMFAAQAPGDTAVYFLNIYPGSEIYELEGHSAIVVDIKDRPTVAYNFGVFDFEQPNFVYRFVKGETDYMAVAQPFGPFLGHYAMHGRRAVAHRLDFTPEQTHRLVELLQQNVRPENAVYRYNYVKDNCATRPLRAVELAAGDSILLGPAPFEAQSLLWPTFRNVMRRYHSNYPWYQFGIDLALGSGIDYRIDRRETAFAPVELDGMLATATAGDRPLVAETIVLLDNPPFGAVQGPTPWWLSPLFVCWLVFAAALAVAVRDWRRGRLTRWFHALFYLASGLAGCLIAFLVFISVHEATSPNFLIAWLNPLCLLAVILIWIKSARKVLIWYQMLNFALLLVLVCAWPFLPQSANAAFWPLIFADMLLSATEIHCLKKPL